MLGLKGALDARVSDRDDLIRYHAAAPVVSEGGTDHPDLAE